MPTFNSDIRLRSLIGFSLSHTFGVFILHAAIANWREVQ